MSRVVRRALVLRDEALVAALLNGRPGREAVVLETAGGVHQIGAGSDVLEGLATVAEREGTHVSTAQVREGHKDRRRPDFGTGVHEQND